MVTGSTGRAGSIVHFAEIPDSACALIQRAGGDGKSALPGGAWLARVNGNPAGKRDIEQ
jgi:hypothetical protein